MSANESDSTRDDRDEVDRIVSAWKVERPDLDFTPLQVLSRVARLARLLDRARRQAFSRSKLEAWEFDVLAALRRVGSPFQLSPKQLLQQTLVSSGAMTNRIDRLVESGLVLKPQDSKRNPQYTVNRERAVAEFPPQAAPDDDDDDPAFEVPDREKVPPSAPNTLFAGCVSSPPPPPPMKTNWCDATEATLDDCVRRFDAAAKERRAALVAWL